MARTNVNVSEFILVTDVTDTAGPVFFFVFFATLNRPKVEQR